MVTLRGFGVPQETDVIGGHVVSGGAQGLSGCPDVSAGVGERGREGEVDPYQHIKAKYPGEVLGLALALPSLSAEQRYRLANDLHWLLDEVERLRAIEAKYVELLADALTGTMGADLPV